MAPKLERKHAGSALPNHVPGIAGAFVRVTMHNFMCHANAKVELGPRINYITGENGSGKSAILTALAVALGAKMKSIGRSSSKSAKGMIKTGSSFARVVVVISNDGEDAYKPDVFGKSITVEKVLNATGANSLKIKSESGETVGERRDELNKLADHFCIDVDNPITVMTQDMAKKFLHTGDATKKYQFFIDATLLSNLMELQEIARLKASEMKDELNEHLETIPKLREEVEELTHELNSFQRVEELRSKAIDFRNRFAWSKVVETEKELEEEEETQKVYVRKRGDLQDKLLAAEATLKKAAEDSEQFGRQSEEFSRKLQELSAERRQAEHERREAGRRLQKAETDKLNEETSVRKLSKRASDTESKIQRSLEAQRSDTTETDRRLHELSSNLVAAKAEIETCSSDIQKLKAGQEDKQKAQSNFARQKKAAESEINDIRKHISTLKQTATNRLVLFGPKMPQLVGEVQRRLGEFSKPPIGPVGMHVTLKDQSWIVPVEEALGQSMNTFLVAGPKDMDKLRQISKDCGMNNLSIQSVDFNRGRYEIPVNRVPNQNEFTTIKSVLECKHDVVFNFLVDNASIERAVLMRDERKARDMFHSGDAHQKHVTVAFTFHRKIFKTGQIVRDEGFKLYNQAQRLGTDPKAQISSMENRVKEKTAEIQLLSNDEAGCMRAVKDIANMIKKKEAEFNDLNKKAQKAFNDLQQAKIDAEDSSSTGIDVSTLQEELDSLNVDLFKHQSNLKEAEFAFTQAKEAHEIAENVINEKLSLADSYKAEVEQYAKKMQKIDSERQKAVKQAESCKERLQQADRLIEDCEASIQAKRMECKELADKTTAEICDREVAEHAGDITLLPEQLQRLYEKTKESMRKEESRHKRPYDEVNDEISDRKRKLIKLEHGVESSKKIYQKLRVGVRKRLETMKEQARQTAVNVSHRFNYHMQAKGQAGQVEVNYEESQLIIKLKDGTNTRAITDTRALSGGERSYSTLAFSLALGDESDSPFRAMDEFDVFMDAVNRRVSMNTLLEFARSDNHSNKQFLFITPQDLSAINADDPDIKVQKMVAARPS
jgi:chromosome segregation ATPase